MSISHERAKLYNMSRRDFKRKEAEVWNKFFDNGAQSRKINSQYMLVLIEAADRKGEEREVRRLEALFTDLTGVSLNKSK